MDLKSLPAYSKYPIVIPGITPFKNVLKAFKNIHNFQQLYYPFSNYSINIIQIGCGGTGSYVAPEIIRFITSLPEEIQKRISYTLIDGDVVEEKNLKRQCFCEDDIGRNKADVLAETCSEYYGNNTANIKSYPYYITNPNQLYELATAFPILKAYAQPNDCLDDLGFNFDVGLRNTNIPDDILTYIQETEIGYHNDKNKSCFIEAYVDCDSDVKPHCFSDEELEEYHYGMLGSNTTTIVPIIIDCVDKTTVRNLINSMLESQMYKNTFQEQVYKMLIESLGRGYSYRSLPGDINIGTVVSKINREEAYAYVVPNGKIFVTTTYTNENQEKYPIVNDYISARIESNRDVLFSVRGPSISIPATYIISSGNGKYTGQVIWGRYSNLGDHIKPITFTDVFGKDEQKGSILSLDKCENEKLDDIYAKFYNNSFSSYTLSYSLNYTHIVKIDPHVEAKHVSPGLKLGEFKVGTDFNLDNTALNKYFRGLYLWNKKFGGIIERFNSDDNERDLYSYVIRTLHKENILFTDFSLQAIGHSMCNDLINEFRNNIPNVDNILELGNTYNYLYSNCVDASTCKIKNMDGQYRNFQDWVSRYISVPSPYKVSPDLINIDEDRLEEQRSCAEHAADTFEQSIQANKTAANLVFNYVSQILNGLLSLHTENEEEVRIDNAGCYFDIRKNSFANIPINTQYLKQYESVPEGRNVLDVAFGRKTPDEVWDLEHPKEVIKEIA